MSHPNVSRMTGTRLELPPSVACHHSSNKIVGCLSTIIQILANDTTSDWPTFWVYKIGIFFNNRGITQAQKGWATRGGLRPIFLCKGKFLFIMFAKFCHFYAFFCMASCTITRFVFYFVWLLKFSGCQCESSILYYVFLYNSEKNSLENITTKLCQN